MKKIWGYVKENQLQDPNDRRYIICDEKLKRVMGQDKVKLTRHQASSHTQLSNILIKGTHVFDEQGRIHHCSIYCNVLKNFIDFE